MKLRLTEATIHKISTSKVQEDFFHCGTPGAGLRVSREGSKSFFMIYASPTVLDAKGRPLSRRLNLGAHASGRAGQGPYLTLSEFTALYEILRGELRRGLDPAESEYLRLAKKTRSKVDSLPLASVPEWLSAFFPEVREGSVSHLMILWFDAAKTDCNCKLAPRTLSGYLSTARTHLVKQLGNAPATDLTSDQIEDLLAVVAKTSPQMVRHILKVISGAYEYARSNVKEFRRLTNPARGIKVQIPKGRRDRWLSDEEIPVMLESLPSLSDPLASDVYRLILASGCRPGEAAGIETTDIIQVNGQRVWKIRYKSDRDHLVPLIGEIGEIINRRVMAVESGSLFWKIDRTKEYPPQLRKANKELGELTAGKIAPFRPHDLRRTMRTHLDMLEVRQEVSECLLNHVKQGEVRTYSIYDFWKERIAALTLWHQKLGRLESGMKAAA